MGHQQTVTTAPTTADDVHPRVSDEEARHWQLHLLLPAGARPDVIPESLLAVLASLFDVLLRRPRELARRPFETALRVSAESNRVEGSFVRESMADLASLLAQLWGEAPNIHPVAAASLPRVVCRVAHPSVAPIGQDAAARGAQEHPATAVAFTPDVDAMAAASRILDSAGHPPVLVVFDAIAEHWVTSQGALARILDNCRSRLATLAVRSPDTLHHTTPRISSLGSAPTGALRLLHAMAAACVALACDLNELQLPQNGVASLNLPITASVLASQPEAAMAPAVLEAVSRLFLRMTGRLIRIHNPLLHDTPAEVVAELMAASDEHLERDVDALAGLVASDDGAEASVDHIVSILAGLPPEATLPEALGRKLMQPLLTPVSVEVADLYVRQICAGAQPSAARLQSYEGMEGHVGSLAAELTRRHIASVRGVMGRAVRQFADDIVAGSLDPTCLLMRAIRPRASTLEARIAETHVFRKRSDCWEVRFERDETVYLKESKGVSYIHILLQSPRRVFSAVELRDAVAGHERLPTSSLGPRADALAVAAYRRRWVELRAELDDAVERNDLGRSEALAEELDALERELSACVGLGGRLRQNSDNERARKSVSNAIHRAINHLRSVHPELSRHLHAALKIGTSVAYMPLEELEWNT